MAEWILKRFRLRRVIGLLKDQAAVGGALARRRFVNLHIAVIRATTHEEGAPPDENYVQSVLSAGSGSRMNMSYCICLIVKRLNKTQNWAVALKCLILLHRGLHDGGFMFQDQLSFYPASGGRNHLNLSKFKDRRNPFTWEVSAWIRWYAKFLDQLLLTCRILGFFLDSTTVSGMISADKISSLATEHLLKEILALRDLLQEACDCKLEGVVVESVLVRGALQLVILDSLKGQEQLGVRLSEVLQRLTDLPSPAACQLLQVCDTLSLLSMNLLHLMEVGRAFRLLQTLDCPDQILLTDYELMKMKEGLRTASMQKLPRFKIRLAVPDSFSPL